MSTTPAPIALYLRDDGSLLLTQGDKLVEIALSPRQLIELGADAMRVALAHDPSLLGTLAEVLDTTTVHPIENAACLPIQ